MPKKLYSLILVVLLAIILALGGCTTQAPTPAPAARGLTNMESLALSGALNVSGAATLASTLALTGNATLAGQVVFTAPTQVTVTANSTIATGNYTVVPLTAAGAVGTSSVTGCSTAGKLTILRNIANQTITITDTGTIMLGRNAALGQYDTLTLLGDGTNCLQISKADN